MFKQIIPLFILLSFGNVVFGEGDRVIPKACQDELEAGRIDRALQLENTFSKFARAPASSHDHLKLFIPWPKGTRVIELERMQPGRPPWNKSKWRYRAREYDFVDVGFRNLELDILHMNSQVANHLLNYPDQNLDIHFSDSWMEAEDTLSDWNFTLLSAVKENYRRKTYLGAEDFYLMDEIGSASANNDTFALLESSERQDAHAYGRTPLVTIQVRYHGDRNAFTPTLKGVLQSQGLPVNEDDDRFPLEYRLDPSERERFHALLYGSIEAESTCEIIRYTKFKQVPQSIMDKIILSVFRRIKLRGMETILIGVDEHSQRLFARYGFQVLMPLPVAQNQIREYVAFLRVHSRAFETTLTKLEARSRTVLQE